MRSLEDSAEVSPVRTLSRLSLLQDWDKANGFADPLTRTSGMPQLHRTSTFPKPASGKLEKGSWLRQRPGATQFEILQASELGWQLGAGPCLRLCVLRLKQGGGATALFCCSQLCVI